MKCPYCLSDVDNAASVCRVCTKDLYLLAPLAKRIEELEERLNQVSDRERLEQRILELEQALHVQEQRVLESRSIWSSLLDIVLFVVMPLTLLVGAHALITVVYDASLVYLRIVSILLPLPFAYFLFAARQRILTPWFMASAMLAACSVIGMSGVTHVVDGTPLMPQNALEWREFIEYAMSITFSFLTGMLLGGMAYIRRHQHRLKVNPLVRVVVNIFAEGKLSPEAINSLMKSLTDYGSTIVALGTTAVSIYTGLKAVLT